MERDLGLVSVVCFVSVQFSSTLLKDVYGYVRVEYGYYVEGASTDKKRVEAGVAVGGRGVFVKSSACTCDTGAKVRRWSQPESFAVTAPPSS